MGSAGLQWDVADVIAASRMNQKTQFVGTGAQINLLTTYAGMLAYCTSTGIGFTVNHQYVRNAANSAWNQLLITSTLSSGDLLYSDGTDLVRRAIGNADESLRVVSSLPTWYKDNVGCKATMTGIQNSGNFISFTSVQLNTEDFDTDTIHDTVTNNSRLTCKTAGVYTMCGYVKTDLSANPHELRILLNGITELSREKKEMDQHGQIAAMHKLAVNDYVELQYATPNGGNILAGTWFAMYRLGPG